MASRVRTEGAAVVQVPDFLALGDSFAEGMEDELGPTGRHLGRADRVAAALAGERSDFVYGRGGASAVRGRLAVRCPQ